MKAYVVSTAKGYKPAIQLPSGRIMEFSFYYSNLYDAFIEARRIIHGGLI